MSSTQFTDIDSDGQIDLVVATEDSRGIWTSLQRDGDFSSPHALVRGALSPATMVAADFDGDGCIDLAASFRGVPAVVTIPGTCHLDD